MLYISLSTDGSDLKIFKEWLDTAGRKKYIIVGTGMIEITDPEIETLFVLKWLVK